MGCKRPFDEEEFQELPLKQSKQVDCGNKLTSFAEVYSCYEPSQRANTPGGGESMHCKSQMGDGLENDNSKVILDLPDKELEISAPLSWGTSSTSEEDTGSGAAVCSALATEYIEYCFNRRSVIQFEDSYSSLLARSPRKLVPIGPNYQAEIPEWDPRAMDRVYLGSDLVVDPSEEKLMGDSVLLMPDPELLANSCANVGDGGKDCLCTDEGSLRCVQQHVKEARDRVRVTLGYEKFMQLGFGDMGEEVSEKWTKEEEQVFHEVIYSNPVSLGKKFWDHLSMVFPSRTKKEIVSYYYNVFMLRRRAVQNRSSILDIDSDDDEWQGSFGRARAVAEDEYSADESLVDQDGEEHGYYFPDDVDDDGDDGDDGDNEDNLKDEDGNSDDDIVSRGNITGNEIQRSPLSKSQIHMSLEDCRSEFVVHSTKTFGTDKQNFDAQNVSCAAFECQSNVVEPLDSADPRAAVTEHDRVGLHSSVDGFGTGYLLEPCDAKVCDARFPMSPLEGFDLLPTGNMIEEIFGPSTQNSKFSDEKKD